MIGMAIYQRKKVFITLVALLFAFTLLVATAGCAGKQASTEGGASPIVLGVVTALGSIEGADSLRAVQMAAEEINAQGGVLVGKEKHPLKIVSADTREHEAGVPVSDALMALEKIITEQKPHAIVSGAFRSEVLLASMDLVSKYKVPYITNIAMTPELGKRIGENPEKYKYIFRMGTNAANLSKYLQQTYQLIGKEFGFNKVYIVTQDVMWAKGTGGTLEKWFKDNGWEVLGFDTYPTGASDFSSSLGRVIAQKAQVLVPVFDMPQATVLAKQARAMKVPALIAGNIASAVGENTWQVLGSDLEGIVEGGVYQLGPIAAKAVPKSVEFNQNYGKRWGEELRAKLSGNGPGPSYDAVYVLAAAIERAGSLEPDAIVSALEKTDMNGVIGRIRFNKTHEVVYGFDPKETAIGAVFQWRSPGIRVPVFPETVAEGRIELPSGTR